MPLPLLFVLAWTQDPQTAPVQQEAAAALTTPYEVLEPQRIAATPKIDGILEEEEWDPLGVAGAGQAFLQWEPNRLHVAGRVPEGRDLLVSIDFRNNGWLIGSDNLELRINADGVTARLLDATRVTGPMWIDLAGFKLSSELAHRIENGESIYEVSMKDPGIGLLPVETDATFSIRADAVAHEAPQLEPFIPRVLSKVTLAMQRSAGLPTGLKFNTEGVGKTVAPGDWMRLRLTFNGNNNMNLNLLSMRSEGSAKDGTSKLEVPFPPFDNKGRAFVDYDTTVAASVPMGYKVLKAELKSADAVSSFMQASYRVGPPVDFDLVRQQIPIAEKDRTQKYSFNVRSNTSKRVTGPLAIVVPAPLRVVNTTGWNLQLAGNQRNRMQFELYVPAGTVGTFPITFKGTLNNTPVEQTGYITIGGV